MTAQLFSALPVPPPATENEAILWIQLIRSRRVGPTTFLRLMREFHNAKAALAALPEVARSAGVKTYTPFPFEAAKAEFAAGHAAGASLICLGSTEYPPLLADISDPPPILWAKGRHDLALRDCVALVGARNASSLGTRMARHLATGLGKEGFTVVSGLARGVDAAAHLAALESGTIAVMAGGIDRIYPPENQRLAEGIAGNGLLLSEHPPGLSPQARHFPRRNRIISGLCRAVLVVEGAAKSGSLITAREALDQGREVMAVPGHPLDARASGCNMLIRDGATLVRSAQDIIAALASHSPPPIESKANPETPKTTIPEALELSRRILSLLSPSPIPEDQLIRELNLPTQAISPQLLALELEGRLLRQSGGMLSLAV